MNTHVFLITAKTNLHVGNESGGEFSIIDKAIQRDPLTNLPCINSSSLKGSIKEFCVHEAKLNNVKELFGSTVDEKGKVINTKPEDTQKGSAIFFDAKLLYLPQQGAPINNQNQNMLFHYVTTQKIKNMMVERVKLFDNSYTAEKIITPKGTIEIDDKKFQEYCSDDNLPIIARNVLENGESKNLWYEQVLPAETVLYTIIREKGDILKNALNGKIVQIGANATIGYGYCKFDCIN